MITKDWLVKTVEQINISKKKKQRLIGKLNKIITSANKASNSSIEELYREAGRIYDSFIDYFYSDYETTSYIRHDTSVPGTRNGLNLYRGQDIRLDRSSDYYQLILNFTGKDMKGGYEYHTASQVLDYVMQGYRFYKSDGNPLNLVWRHSYHSSFIKVDDSTIDEAFDVFIDNWDDNYNRLFKQKWKTYYK